MKEAEETEFVGQIIDIVDDFLEARNVSLPVSEKAKEEDGIALNNSAVICGSDYDELADKFKGLLKSWAIVRQTPEQVEEDYRERERDYREQDAYRHLLEYFDGDKEKVDMLYDETDLSLLVDRFEDEFDCNVPENEIWEQVVENYVKFG